MTKRAWKSGAVLLLSLALLGCEKPAADAQATTAPAALTVAVEPAARETVRRTLEATGSVAAWEEITVSAEISGLAVVEVLVAEGDQIAQGQLLARLNDSLLLAQIAEQEAAVEEARATLELALSAERRGETLLAKNTISKETQEERSATSKTSRARLAQAEAVLTRLRAELAQTRILAPAAGTVSQKAVPLGTVVQAGSELFHILRDSRLEVEAALPEQLLAQVRPGQAVTVTGPAGEIVAASVRAVAETVDSATRLGLVYVALPAGTTLKQGMFARLSIETAAVEALTLPEAALVWREGQAQVFALRDDGAVAARAVVTGARQAGRVEILQGLEGDERIVVAGAGFLNDGDQVRVAAQRPLATAEGAAR